VSSNREQNLFINRTYARRKRPSNAYHCGLFVRGSEQVRYCDYNTWRVDFSQLRRIVLLEKLMVVQLVNKLTPFMGSKGSLPWSQEPAAGCCFELFKSSPQSHTVFHDFFLSWRWGGCSTQAWMPIYISILHIPQMIWVWKATVEWYWQGKTEELGEKPVPVPLCPQISHGLTRARTRASAVRGRCLTTWAMARPFFMINSDIFSSIPKSHNRSLVPHVLPLKFHFSFTRTCYISRLRHFSWFDHPISNLFG
jgi:hypothetical protein